MSQAVLKLKLDLHTHCFELPGYNQVNRGTVARIVEQIRERGLDGIAVTEHEDKSYGYRVMDMVSQFFPGQAIIIPGWEIGAWPEHCVELFLPDGVTFRFLAHPRYPAEQVRQTPCLHGIELENLLHGRNIKQEEVREVARRHNLILLSNSDAHSPYDIGHFYNEVSLEELSQRARQT